MVGRERTARFKMADARDAAIVGVLCAAAAAALAWRMARPGRTDRAEHLAANALPDIAVGSR